MANFNAIPSCPGIEVSIISYRLAFRSLRSNLTVLLSQPLIALYFGISNFDSGKSQFCFQYPDVYFFSFKSLVSICFISYKIILVNVLDITNVDSGKSQFCFQYPFVFFLYLSVLNF